MIKLTILRWGDCSFELQVQSQVSLKKDLKGGSTCTEEVTQREAETAVQRLPAKWGQRVANPAEAGNRFVKFYSHLDLNV